MRAAIGRLTENEKECLRRRLTPQTAKEMALELRVSPHAVEKRLKMARTKLGLPSSLQAARLLAQVESQPLVPQASDLSANADRSQVSVPAGGMRRRWMGGITAMSILIAAALAFTLAGESGQQEHIVHHVPRVPATPEQATAFLGQSFEILDRNHSGFLEAEEAPPTAIGSGDGPPQRLSPERAGAYFIARLDRDGDGRISRSEYVVGERPGILAAGVPANWRRRP